MSTRYASLGIFLLLVVLVAALAGSFEAGEWYFTMYKPSWTIPAYLFGVTWALVFVLMALAMWKVWISGHSSRNGALLWWLLQLALIIAWSWMFFGIHRSGWAMAELLLLMGLQVLSIKVFSSSSRAAAVMMLPGLFWAMYLWALNIAIWLINGGGIGSILPQT